ncbi:MAG: hypothetical protein AAFO74_12890 [Pseudomonadota bacterium]
MNLTRHVSHRRRAEARQMNRGVMRLLQVYRPGANFAAAEVMPVKRMAEAHLKACEIDYLREAL